MVFGECVLRYYIEFLQCWRLVVYGEIVRTGATTCSECWWGGHSGIRVVINPSIIYVLAQYNVQQSAELMYFN